MVGTSSSSSSSSSSPFGFLDDVSVRSCDAVPGVVKLICSYGGKILPRFTDGKLRYVGGDTRVLAIDRSVSFSELQQKLEELCGWSAVSLRCQLPADDLDALVSITSDEDLLNLFEEYDLASREKPFPLKIRAFLHAPLPYLPPPALASKSPHASRVLPHSMGTSSPKSPAAAVVPPAESIAGRFVRIPVAADEIRRHVGCLFGGGHRPHHHLVHHGKQWH